MDQKHNPSLHARNLLLAIAALFLLVLAVSFSFDFATTRQRYEELAQGVARSIFQQFVAVRRLTTQHDGVYVNMTDDLLLEADFKDLAKNVTTTDGMVLTRIHPEYLTKLVSDILVKESGIKVDVTSLKLTSKINEADSWEKEALERFAKGSKEEFAVVDNGQSTAFRYMAPLITEESCLPCHGRQGYKSGDIRGGLSVSFPFTPFQQAARRDHTRVLVVHLLFLVSGLAVIYFLGKSLMRRVLELQAASSRIKKLEGILPICANCKKIRAEGTDPKKQDSWTPVEVFIRDRTDAEFSHGFCPACLKELYNWVDDEPPKEEGKH